MTVADEPWFCEMNPDENYNTCEAAEEQEEEKEWFDPEQETVPATK